MEEQTVIEPDLLSVGVVSVLLATRLYNVMYPYWRRAWTERPGIGSGYDAGRP